MIRVRDGLMPGAGSPEVVTSRVATPRALALAVTTMVAGLTACADKGFTPPAVAHSTVIALQLTTASQQSAAAGAKWLLVGAGYDGVPEDPNDDGDVLAYRFIPFTSGTQRITLPVDIARCLAHFASRGRSTCPLLVAAALVADTMAFADTTGDGDIFTDAFDAVFVGPFDVAPGRVPVIPAIDLSASRYAVVRWEGDEAFRLGGRDVPVSNGGPPTGIPLAGGGVALVVPTQGFLPFVGNQPAQGPYPQLAFLQDGSWKRATATGLATGLGPFTGVAAFAQNDIYASHRSGLFRYDGASFARITPTTNDSLFSVGVTPPTSSTKMVVAGAFNGVWVGNTQTWNKYGLAGAQRIDGVCITGPQEAFASSTSGSLWRFNGASWTAVPAPATSAKFALQCPAPGEAFVLSQGAGGGMFRWNGSGWTNVPTTGLNAGRLVTWGVVSANEMYAWGDSSVTDRAFYRFNGSSWTEVGRKRFTQGGNFAFGAMWADPRGGAAYVATSFGRVERVTPGGVTVLSYQPAMRDVSISSPTNAVAVGWNMFLARWDGGKWTVDSPPPGMQTVRILQGAWTGGPANAWAVGNGNTILRWDGATWSKVSDIFSPVATQDNYNAVTGVGSTVWIVGDNTILRCTAPATCANEASGGTGALYGIWSTTDGSTKVAVGAGGRIIRSVAGGAWQSMTSPTTRALARVSGSGPNDIWAVGDSVLLRYDGTQWTNIPMTGDLQFFRSRVPAPQQSLFQLGLWVRSPTEVYLGGETGGIARWDGREWTEMRYVNDRRRILGIAGVANGCALVVTDGQSDQPGPTLWRGVSPSGCFANPMPNGGTWP